MDQSPVLIEARLKVAVDATAAVEGGGLSYLAQQLPALAALGVRILVFARRRAIDELRSCLPQAEFVAVPDSSKVARLARMHFSLGHEARSRGANVIYCPGSTAPLRTPLPTVLCIQNAHIFTPNGPRSGRYTLLRLVAWISALRASFVVQISRSMDEAFEQIAALEVPSTVILSGAGNIAARTRPATGTVATGRPYIVAISNLYDHKRVDLIIDAYATEPTLRATHDLVIGGKEMVPGTIAILRKQARELGLADSQVRFPGFVSGSTLAALYQSASLYVSASEHEAFPLTPAEALISGLPVVLTDIPPFREIYGDWATFVPVGQVVGLRRAMVAALDNGARDDHGAAVSQRFSWNRNAQELAAVLLRVASGPRPTWRESFDRVQWSGIPRFARAVFGSAAPHGKRS